MGKVGYTTLINASKKLQEGTITQEEFNKLVREAFVPKSVGYNKEQKAETSEKKKDVKDEQSLEYLQEKHDVLVKSIRETVSNLNIGIFNVKNTSTGAFRSILVFGDSYDTCVNLALCAARTMMPVMTINNNMFESCIEVTDITDDYEDAMTELIKWLCNKDIVLSKPIVTVTLKHTTVTVFLTGDEVQSIVKLQEELKKVERGIARKRVEVDTEQCSLERLLGILLSTR